MKDRFLCAGRGRWANHVKKGNGGRGLRPLPTASSQDTPRVTRGGGRGRRGGRWGSRPSKDAFPEDTCLLAFGNIVEALDNRISGGPLCNPHQVRIYKTLNVLHLNVYVHPLEYPTRHRHIEAF